MSKTLSKTPIQRKPRKRTDAGNKPRAKPGPKPGTKQKKDRPKTSAQSSNSQQNLTLHDWLTIFDYCDKNPTKDQGEVVEWFKNLKEGQLIFSQPTLSRKFQQRATLEAQSRSFKNALSTKCVCTVTRPDIEAMLYQWGMQMNGKGEVYTGDMLVEKRRRFEKLVNVPEDERLEGRGWIASFKEAHGIHEICRHGKAGSVNLQAVAEERACMQTCLSDYALEDIWNADETSFFYMASPDRGLSDRQLSGKKSSKAHITVLVACSAAGEKFQVVFIGKSKQPRCFAKVSPASRGFYYRNNKKAWMTGTLFDEFLRIFNNKMRRRKRHVILTLDNFAGHDVPFAAIASNIRIEFFMANMTPFVQPCDAGIIRALKAYYRKLLCERAIDRDEDGCADIFEINLLEAMILLEQAWNSISVETVVNCWRHTMILPQESSDEELDAVSQKRYAAIALANSKREEAWEVLLDFAQSSDMTLPMAEEEVRAIMGDGYKDGKWSPAFAAVMEAENDVEVAVEAIRSHMAADHPQTFTCEPTLPTAQPAIQELEAVEADLKESMEELKRCKRLFFDELDLDKVLFPEDKEIIGEDEYAYEGTDVQVERQIMNNVQHRMGIESGEVLEMDIDEDDDSGDPLSTEVVPNREIAEMCSKLEAVALDRAKASSASDALELARLLRNLCRDTEREVKDNMKQSCLDTWFTS